MSWRDETPQPVQDDLDQLAATALGAAEHLLLENGELLPFAVHLDDDGPAMVAADPGEGEQPLSQSVLDLLYASSQELRDSLRGVAFVSMVGAEGRDAVRAELEHRDGGPAIAMFLPYAVDASSGEVTFGEPSASPGERRVWRDQPPV